MTTDPDPFEEGQRAAQENIPAEGNPYRDGSEEHALWAAGHERVAGAAERNLNAGRVQPTRSLQQTFVSFARSDRARAEVARASAIPRTSRPMPPRGKLPCQETSGSSEVLSSLPSWLGPGHLLASGPFAKATEPMARIAPLRYRRTSFPSSPRQD